MYTRDGRENYGVLTEIWNYVNIEVRDKVMPACIAISAAGSFESTIR